MPGARWPLRPRRDQVTGYRDTLCGPDLRDKVVDDVVI